MEEVVLQPKKKNVKVIVLTIALIVVVLVGTVSKIAIDYYNCYEATAYILEKTVLHSTDCNFIKDIKTTNIVWDGGVFGTYMDGQLTLCPACRPKKFREGLYYWELQSMREKLEPFQNTIENDRNLVLSYRQLREKYEAMTESDKDAFRKDNGLPKDEWATYLKNVKDETIGVEKDSLALLEEVKRTRQEANGDYPSALLKKNQVLLITADGRELGNVTPSGYRAIVENRTDRYLAANSWESQTMSAYKEHAREIKQKLDIWNVMLEQAGIEESDVVQSDIRVKQYDSFYDRAAEMENHIKRSGNLFLKLLARE